MEKSIGRRKFQAIVHHSDDADLNLGVQVLQLPPQEGYVHFHIVVLGVGFVAPDLHQQVFLGDDLLLIQHEQLHHFELLAAEADIPVSAGEGEAAFVQGQVPAGEDVRVPKLRLPPGQGPDAGHELPGLEGLGQVIVGAPVQSLHPVGELGPGREHEDRRGLAGLPQLPQHREAVHFGQHHIQDDDIVNTGEGLVQAGFPVVADVGGIAVQLQQVLEGGGQADLVLNDQYAHEKCTSVNGGLSPPARRPRWPEDG